MKCWLLDVTGITLRRRLKDLERRTRRAVEGARAVIGEL